MDILSEFYDRFVITYRQNNIEREAEMIQDLFRAIYPYELSKYRQLDPPMIETISQHLTILHQSGIVFSNAQMLDSHLLEPLKVELLD